jgi:WD40 repeat protein
LASGVPSPLRVPRGSKNEVARLAFHPDGATLLAGTFYRNSTPRLIHLSSDRAPQITDIDDLSSLWTLAFSPNGDWTMLGGDKLVFCHRVGTKVCGESWVDARHKEDVKHVAVSPDGKFAVSLSNSGIIGEDTTEAYLWQLTGSDPTITGKKISTASTYANALAISGDSRWIVINHVDGALMLFDLTAPQGLSKPVEMHAHPGGVVNLAMSSDGAWLATAGADQTIRLWDLRVANPGATGVILGRHSNRFDDETERPLVFSPDNRLLVSSDVGADARVWRLDATDVMAAAKAMAQRRLTDDEQREFLGVEVQEASSGQ